MKRPDTNLVDSLSKGGKWEGLKAFSLILLVGVAFVQPAHALYGDIGTHDPSALAKDKDGYHIWATGNGVSGKVSTDLISWKSSSAIFSGFPAWIKTYVPLFAGNFWAPAPFRMNGKYFVYYAASDWGTFNCAIGVATSTTIDPVTAKWTDQGMVVYSANKSQTNTIDPGVFRDDNGRVYLTYGTYNGAAISVAEIDTTTGKVKSGTSPVKVSGAGEGSGMIKHNGYYYLTWNRGSCCNGTGSTYYVCVGRAKAPQGPYTDKNGTSLISNPYGTTLFSKSGRFIGPSGPGYFKDDDGTVYLTYHFYDGNDGGKSKLDIATIKYVSDWPVITRAWLDDGTYRILNAATSAAWDAAGGSLALATYTKSSTQAWKLVADATGYYTITASSGTVAQAKGTSLALGSGNGATSQKFRIERSSDGTFVVCPISDSLTAGGSGTGLPLSSYTGSATQKWRIDDPTTTAITKSSLPLMAAFSPLLKDSKLRLGLSDILTSGTWSLRTPDGKLLQQGAVPSEFDPTVSVGGMPSGLLILEVREAGTLIGTHRLIRTIE